MDPALQALRRQKCDLEEEITSLQAKLKRVAAAIEALTAGDLFDHPSELRRRRLKPAGSLKQMAYTVLHDGGTALTAQEILDQIEKRFEQSIVRTSMSPQLSRLGQQEFLIRRGNKWALNPARPMGSDEFYLIERNGDLL